MLEQHLFLALAKHVWTILQHHQSSLDHCLPDMHSVIMSNDNIFELAKLPDAGLQVVANSSPMGTPAGQYVIIVMDADIN
jgi:hypothetical protein